MGELQLGDWSLFDNKSNEEFLMTHRLKSIEPLFTAFYRIDTKGEYSITTIAHSQRILPGSFLTTVYVIDKLAGAKTKHARHRGTEAQHH